MRKLLARVGALVIGLVVVLVGVRQAGSHDAGRLAVIVGSGYSATPQACWYGICPGQTSTQMAVDVLTDVAKTQHAEVVQNVTLNDGGYLIPYDACSTVMSPNWSVCLRPEWDTNAITVRIKLIGSDIRLSDVITELGPPTSILMCTGLSPNFAQLGIEGVSVTFQYGNGVSVIAFKESKHNPPLYPVPPDEWRISPDMQVYEMTFARTQSYMSSVDNEMTFAWRGFGEGTLFQFSCGN